ncbi:TPA: Tol-Pal system protein TolB, partial [Klebsiella oxytoca]|nr:Tol-Pal system protein TolB [Klebsiella oxytoca]HAT1685299.1 Tol-Pal system protein TolB [Klebsiella oxytoca]
MRPLTHFISLLLLFWLTTADAEIRIEITQGNNEAMPVAVVPFSWSGTGAAPAETGTIIADDLRHSGRFNPVNTRLLPQTPDSASAVTPSLWRALGVSYVVVGNIQPGANGQYLISYQMVNTSTDAEVVMSQAQFSVSKPAMRDAAHTISNRIYEKLTGTPGAFRTRIAFVARTRDLRFPWEIRVSDYDGYHSFVVRRSS